MVSSSEEMKTYKMSAQYKKSVIQEEWYSKTINEIQHRFCRQMVWRNGEFEVTLTPEQKMRYESLESGDETNLSDFDDYEFISTFDCCAVEYLHITPAEFDVEEALEDEDGDMVDPEDDGWELEDTNYFIMGPICFE